MSDVKQILVVDDHFEMLELLRSMLELSGHDYEVLAVPSAEEAMLELLRMKFDLLITDVRLPGMSGFDFVRRVRRRQPDLPVIMITAYSSAQGQKEADELDVYRYFAKPLDTDNVLTAVHTALYGESIEPVDLPPPARFKLPENVERRLQSLQLDTGATGLVLSTIHGQVLLELGENSRLDVPRIVAKIAENVANSLVLAELLGEINPFTIQYHTGKATELYNANVGRDYFVTLLFGMESRRGRIGTIWVFAQRAIRDLVSLLPPLAEMEGEMGRSPASLPSSKPAAPTSPLPSSSPGDETAVAQMPHPALTEPPAPTEADMADLLSALNLEEPTVETNLDSFWDEAIEQVDAPVAADTLSLAEAAAFVQGLPAAEAPMPEETPAAQVEDNAEPDPQPAEVDMDGLLAALNLSEAETAVDLDEFWDEAVSDSSNSSVTNGLSFAEAMQRGLINMDDKE